jgi:porphyrinogen peroxidase
MTSPQSGIFALGTSSHAYLEFDLRPGTPPRDLIAALANLREPRTTIGGINLVSGFRPELWRAVVSDGMPRDFAGFNEDIRGAGRYVMPATQHDAVLWLSGSAYDVVFDESRQAIAALADLAAVADETSSWPYRYDRDLTGFIDGTENPSLLEAPGVLLVPEGQPGAGGTILLLQKWAHEAARWEALEAGAQERVIGRRKSDSIELDPRPADSHVARTDQDEFGHIFRRNMPYGTVTNHGTMFVGFSADQRRLSKMLESMAGVTDGIRDALTNYTKPLTGAYYFIPSVEAISRFVTAQPAG